MPRDKITITSGHTAIGMFPVQAREFLCEGFNWSVRITRKDNSHRCVCNGDALRNRSGSWL